MDKEKLSSDSPSETTEDKNISLLLSKLKAQDEKLAKFEKQLDETLAFNRQLLSTSDVSSTASESSAEARHQALEDKLYKALHKSGGEK